MNKIILFGIVLLFWSTKCIGQHATLRGHAHNDYHKPNPLFKALEYGFGSIEIDICLDKSNQLKVAHNPVCLGAKKTLQELYLEPISQMINNGDTLFNYSKEAPLTLMLDLKTNADSTYHYLKQVLMDYRFMLTTYRNGNIIEQAGPVKICISGRKPWWQIGKDSIEYARLDANILPVKNVTDVNREIKSTEFSEYVERVSAPWRNFFSLGILKEDSDERNLLYQLVDAYHDKNIELRFYAAPSNKKVWKVLLDAGVDWINVDDYKKFADFYSTYTNNK